MSSRSPRADAGLPPKVTIGPQIGVPPSLEQVQVERLGVDNEYQRTIDGPQSRKLIAGMMKQWDWRLCGPIMVSRRDNGDLKIIDGQHRHAGAVARGDIPFLPCVMLSGLGLQDEADVFVGLNNKRQKLGQADLFNAMLLAGDDDARALREIVDETGWRIVRSTATDQFKPGDLACAPMLARQVAAFGSEPVREALRTLREAYPEEPIGSISRLIQALIRIYRADRYKDKRPQIVAAMAPIASDAWYLRAERHRQRSVIRISQADAIMALILDATGFQPIRDTAPRPAPAPLARAPGTPVVQAPADDLAVHFPKGERVWCEQCEQRVTEERARRCLSPHCKMKRRS